MRQLLYVSNTSLKIPPQELAQILAASRRNNSVADVTGLLLHLKGAFLQVLEGCEHAVDEIYARIVRDKRHWGAHILLDHHAPRAFREWSMGFRELEPGHVETDHMFRVTRDAIAGRLDQTAAKELAIMLQTSYRVHENNEPSA